MKYIGETYFLLGEIYFLLGVFCLMFFGMIINKYSLSLYNSNLIIDLSVINVIFLIFFVYFMYDVNIDLFLGFRITNLVFLFKSLILFFLIFFIYSCKNIFVFEKILNFEFIILILFSIESFFFIVMVENFFLFFLSIELQLLCFYVLAAFKRYNDFSVEAGMKYFLFGAFSSGLLLYGISLLYGLLGTLDFLKIYFLLNNFNHMYLMIFLSFLFIIVGMLFKLGSVPFH